MKKLLVGLAGLAALVVALVLVAWQSTASPAQAQPAAVCGEETEFMAGTDTSSGSALNPLSETEPTGPLAVVEPNTSTHQAVWVSAPITDPITLCPGPVTLDFVMMNMSENEPGSNDICWDKHWHLPDGSFVPIVASHCFENPLVSQASLGKSLGDPCPFDDPPPPPANCVAVAEFVTETVPSLVTAPTVIPAGSFKEVTIFCPGSSFVGIFFNDGLDVTGDGVPNFTKITEPVLVPPPVGGIVQVRADGSDAPRSATEGAGSSFPYAALVSGLAAATVVALAGGWYARRRWLW